jgi:PAS domain S-box-containing protein
MKRAIQPTSIERKMRENDFIVSKTNPKGIITYGNPIFIEFSGYTEAELLGSQHNIIRHPDMPRAAFKLAWDTIQSGREFFGYVKNMSKDGGSTGYSRISPPILAPPDRSSAIPRYGAAREPTRWPR